MVSLYSRPLKIFVHFEVIVDMIIKKIMVSELIPYQSLEVLYILVMKCPYIHIKCFYKIYNSCKHSTFIYIFINVSGVPETHVK